MEKERKNEKLDVEPRGAESRGHFVIVLCGAGKVGLQFLFQ